MMQNGGSNYGACSVRKNGSDAVDAGTNPDSDSDGGAYSSTNSVVLHLVRGDKVDLGACSPNGSIYSSYAFTTFSGFLLKAD